jgi:hypothetical protein
LSYQEDLSQLLGSTDAYVGFTSGTGAEYADHDVLAWDFSNCYAPNGVPNTAPTVDAGPDVQVPEGKAVALNGSATDPDVGQTLTSTWSYAWDPTSPQASQDTGTCTFDPPDAASTTINCDDNGLVIATLSASDGTVTRTDTTAVTVTNAAPRIALIEPMDQATGTTYTVGTDVPVTLQGPLDDGLNDTFTCTVDWGDGTVVGPTTLAACTASHQYTAAGSYPFNVTVADDDGDTASQGADLLVEAGQGNTPPTVDAGADQQGDEGQAIPLHGSVSPAQASTWSYSWDSSTKTPTGTCQFNTAADADTTIRCDDNGVVIATLTAGSGSDAVSDSATVTVGNVAPTVTITAPDDASTGTYYGVSDPMPLSYTDLDPGSADAQTCTVDWGDGTGALPCDSFHVYVAEDVYTVTVTVTDDDGGVGTDSVDVDVEAPDVGGTGDTKAKVTGGGWLLTAGKTHFALEAVMDKKGHQHGHLELHTYDHHHFHGKTVTGLVVTGSTASWSGTGDWDHQHGYTYTVQVIDGGDGKLRAADHIELSIYDPNGALVFMLTGNLVGGNIKVHQKP